jgi:hypothetical protein
MRQSEKKKMLYSYIHMLSSLIEKYITKYNKTKFPLLVGYYKRPFRLISQESNKSYRYVSHGGLI